MRLLCECDDWGPNIAKVNAPLLLEQARNPSRARGYEGKPFHFCPWCGRVLYTDLDTADPTNAGQEP